MSGQVTPEDIVREVIDGLRVSLTVGAARDFIGDDQEKLEEIQESLLIPMGIYQITGNPSNFLEAITEVMGDGWKPSGEWAQYIDAVDQLSQELTDR